MTIERITEKLKKIMKVSVRIKMEQMKNMLELDQKTFDRKILDWANEYDWTIDGDYVVVKKERVDDFITMLDQQNMLIPRLDANNETSQEFVSFSGAKIPEIEVKVLQELERMTNKKFILDNNPGWIISRIVFKTKNQHVSGISLDRGCGKITNLPESIRDLTLVEDFRFFGGKLTSFPHCLIDLKSLSDLCLAETRLDTIPESIGELKSLRRLELHDNNLSFLPASIGHLKALLSLDLHNNRLETLPESIGELVVLLSLTLTKNELRELPDSILKLKDLRYLYIDRKLENTMDARTKNLIEVLKGRGISFVKQNYDPYMLY